jgi:inner membrane protein
MSGANHIVGGTVFTGIFASFFNVNIFEKPVYLFFTAFFAILPDVDHLKSPIGKLFYPIAKWLNIKFGHRTITHSLIFFAGLILAVSSIESFSGSSNITLICVFAYFSHLIFDMVTKQGIPLFWPFMRNPCVIPGNPELRLKSSHFQTEAICFAIFILLGITCQPLFAQGFWTSYNKLFTDLKHLHQEARMSETLLLVDFNFVQEGKEVKGKGYLISSSENEATFFDAKKFYTIKNVDRIKNLNPVRSAKSFKTSDLLFYNVSIDSFNLIIQNKAIISLKVQSNNPFSFISKNVPVTSTNAALEYVFNPIFSFSPDTTKNYANQIELLNYELKKQLQEKSANQQKRYRLTASIAQLDSSIAKMDLYEHEKAVPKLAELRQELLSLDTVTNKSEKIIIQLKQLERLNSQAVKVSISGYINFLNL